MNMNWADLWRVLYQRDLDEQEVADMETYLDSEFPRRGTERGWTPDELRAAMNTVAEKSRKKGEDRCRPPTGPQIKTVIINQRWAKSPRRNEPRTEREGCGLCSPSGLILWYPHVPEGPFTLERLAPEWCITSPCRCSNGVRAEQYNTRLTDEQWALASRQVSEINRSASQLIGLIQSAGQRGVVEEFVPGEECPF